MNYLVMQYDIKTARMDHDCDKCGKTIKKGTEYRSLFNRDVYFKLHIKCHDKQLEKECSNALRRR